MKFPSIGELAGRYVENELRDIHHARLTIGASSDVSGPTLRRIWVSLAEQERKLILWLLERDHLPGIQADCILASTAPRHRDAASDENSPSRQSKSGESLWRALLAGVTEQNARQVLAAAADEARRACDARAAANGEKRAGAPVNSDDLAGLGGVAIWQDVLQCPDLALFRWLPEFVAESRDTAGVSALVPALIWSPPPEQFLGDAEFRNILARSPTELVLSALDVRPIQARRLRSMSEFLAKSDELPMPQRIAFVKIAASEKDNIHWVSSLSDPRLRQAAFGSYGSNNDVGSSQASEDERDVSSQDRDGPVGLSLGIVASVAMEPIAGAWARVQRQRRLLGSKDSEKVHAATAELDSLRHQMRCDLESAEKRLATYDEMISRLKKQVLAGEAPDRSPEDAHATLVSYRAEHWGGGLQRLSVIYVALRNHVCWQSDGVTPWDLEDAGVSINVGERMLFVARGIPVAQAPSDMWMVLLPTKAVDAEGIAIALALTLGGDVLAISEGDLPAGWALHNDRFKALGRDPLASDFLGELQRYLRR